MVNFPSFHRCSHWTVTPCINRLKNRNTAEVKSCLGTLIRSNLLYSEENISFHLCRKIKLRWYHHYEHPGGTSPLRLTWNSRKDRQKEMGGASAPSPLTPSTSVSLMYWATTWKKAFFRPFYHAPAIPVGLPACTNDCECRFLFYRQGPDYISLPASVGQKNDDGRLWYYA